MTNNFTKKRIMTSFIWKLFERTSTQVIQFIVQLILARLLSPSDFGAISIIMVFINLSSIFINGGFNTALIQKKEVTEEDYSTVFYISLFLAIILYILIFISATYISNYFYIEDLDVMMKILGITLIIGAFISVQQAIISKKLLFKKLFFSGFSAALISGIVSIILAYFRYGVWALVFQQLVFQVFLFVSLLFTLRWRPKYCFSKEKAKELFKFSYKILLINLFNTINNNIRSLVIGKRYTSDMLGYYDRGKTIPQIIINNITLTMQSVMLPTLSAYQDDKAVVKFLLRQSIKLSSFIIFPMMIGLVVIAKPIVILLLTEKWLQSVPFVQIFCLIFLIYPINSANLQATTAMGKGEILLKNDVMKKCITLIILACAIIFFDSTFAVAVSMLISTFVCTGISMYPNKKILKYTYKEQLLDMLPSLLLATIMGVIIFALNNVLASIILRIIIGILIYVGSAIIFKFDEYKYIVKLFSELLKK